MLVKVSKDYAGMYGLFNDVSKSVTIKTNKDSMFEEKDEVAERLIEKGVLVKASLNDEIEEADEEIRKEGTESTPDEEDYTEDDLSEEDYLNEPMIVNSFYKATDVYVPDDSYFLMGDNRNNSEDARFWPNQFISIKDIEAKAYIIYWPLNRIGLVK